MSRAAPGLALSVYETTRARHVLSMADHQRIHEAVPNYLMVKGEVYTDSFISLLNIMPRDIVMGQFTALLALVCLASFAA